MFECYVNGHRRVAVLVDENPRYKRLLMIAPHGNTVDVVKFQHDAFAHGGWSQLSTEHAALRYALTFRKSQYFFKTDRALRAMSEVIMELKTLDMKSLVAEYNRITGHTISKFESKAKAIAAIEKASATQQPAEKPASVSAPAPSDVAADIIPTIPVNAAKEPAMTKTDKPAAKKAATTKKAPAAKKEAPAKKVTPAKKAPAAKKADPRTRAEKTAAMTKGSGGMIVKLLKEGKLDDDSIISRVLKEFPDREVNNLQVSWYRSQLYSAGALKKPAKK